MWQAFKRRAAHLGSAVTIDRRRVRDARLQLKLPNPYGGPAWVTATLVLSSQPRGIGDTVRIRGHVDRCFRLSAQSADRTALAHDQTNEAAARSPIKYGRYAAASLARRALDRLPEAAIKRLSGKRHQSWLDMQISTAPLDGGAAALMPEPLRAVYGDRLPQAGPGGPRIGVWSGPAGGARGGLGRLAMVQLDSKEWAGRASKPADDEAHYSLNLSIAELVEPAAGTPDDPSS